MEKLDLSQKSLKKFGVVMGVALAFITMVVFFKHRHLNLLTASLSVAFFLCASVAWKILKPLYIAWMKFASILAWVNTRLLLTVIFYLIFTPLGIVMRIFGMDLLERKIDKKCDSYWKKKDGVSGGYERQF